MSQEEITPAARANVRSADEPAALTRFASSSRYHEAATQVVAGGVNSNVRLGTNPLCFAKAVGAYLFDLDGNSYVDYALGMGPAILGHGHPEVIAAVAETLPLGQIYAGQHATELELGRLIQRLVPSAELVRFGMTGSEMVQAALRVARAHTGRMKIVKFEGHYHGWFDNVLTCVPGPHAEQIAPYRPVPQTAGQSSAALDDLLVLPWNNVEAVTRCFAAHGPQIAAVLMEPMMCNAGAIVPRDGYLQAVKRLCRDHGAVLIFDEVITGFRLGLAGAQGRFGVDADLSVFAKAVGGGFPLAVLAGRSDIMKLIASGTVNHSGTYNSNVVSIAAGLATLQVLSRDSGRQLTEMERMGCRLITGLRDSARALDLNLRVSGVGTVFNTAFGSQNDVLDYASFKQSENDLMRQFLDGLLLRGVRPTGRGTWFISAAHTETDVNKTLRAARDALADLRISQAR